MSVGQEFTTTSIEPPMSIFAKPVSEISAADLQELLADAAVENLRLEFKREIPEKGETLKKLSAFANTMGGLVVIGAAATSSDGRIERLPGVDPKPGYKQTVVQWCFEGVSPPLDVEMSDAIPLPDATGRVCYVLGVNESDRGPHFLNGRKGVYVRTNEFCPRFDAQLANENELRHLFQRRQLVRDRRADLIGRARDRFHIFTLQKYVELGKRKAAGIGARFDLSIGPTFPARPLCEHEQLLRTIQSTTIPWRQVGFPRTTGGGFISQHESVIGLRPGSSFSILEATTWGMLFYATEIDIEAGREEEMPGIHINHFVAQLLVFLEHARLVLPKLGCRGPLTVQMKLDAICGVPWITFADSAAHLGPASQLDNSVTFSIETTAEELATARDTVAANILRYVFFSTNLTNAVDRLEEYINEGHIYNMWDSVESSGLTTFFTSD